MREPQRFFGSRTSAADYERRPLRSGDTSGGWKIRLAIATMILLFSLVSYLSSGDLNPITGEVQRVAGITAEQEIALGLRAVPVLIQQYGGFSRDRKAAQTVAVMGARLVQVLQNQRIHDGMHLPYYFDFHLLADQQTVNAFALPGGQVFITEALYNRLNHEGQLAAVLGHEIGHVLERHSAEQMAKGQLWQGIASAAGVAGGEPSLAHMAQAIGQVVNMKYGRDAELESDRWAVDLLVMAGFSPQHLLELMDILQAASGSGVSLEILSTHPLPANRREHIERITRERFPQGLPPGLR